MKDIYNVLEYKEIIKDIYEEKLFSKFDLTRVLKI